MVLHHTVMIILKEKLFPCFFMLFFCMFVSMQKTPKTCRQFRTLLLEWPVCGGHVLHRPGWCLECCCDYNPRCMVKASSFPCQRNRGSQVTLHLQVFYDLPQKACLGRGGLWSSQMSSFFFATFATVDKSPLMISTISRP